MNKFTERSAPTRQQQPMKTPIDTANAIDTGIDFDDDAEIDDDTDAGIESETHHTGGATTYTCGPWPLPPRHQTSGPRRALVETPCVGAPEGRATPEDLDKLDLLRIVTRSLDYNASPRLYGSRFARNQAEATRANAAIAALMVDAALRPPASSRPTPPAGTKPVDAIALGGAGIVAAGVMLPALMQLFDRNGVTRDSHLKRLDFIRSRYLPSCREVLKKLELDEALALFEEAVDAEGFQRRTTGMGAVSTEVYREIAAQCALGLRALFVAVQEAPRDDHPSWTIDAQAFPQAPPQATAAADQPAAQPQAQTQVQPHAQPQAQVAGPAARKRAATRRGKKA